MAGSTKTVVLAALVGNMMIAVTKFAAASFTGSSAMISEGIHSLVDVGNQVLLLVGLRQAKKPADPAHPYGYGKEIYFYSFIVAILLFAFGGGLSIYEGLKHLSDPKPITSIYINLIVLSLAFIFEGGAWWVAFKEFKKSTKRFHWFRSVNRAKDPALIVVLLEDSAAMLGLIIASGGILLSHGLNMPIIDALTSIAIGAILLVVASWLAYESKSLLVGEAADQEVISHIKQLIINNDEVDDLQNILTMHLSPDEILLNLHVDFAANLTSQQVEDCVTNLEHKIKAAIPEIKWVFIAAKSFAR